MLAVPDGWNPPNSFSKESAGDGGSVFAALLVPAMGLKDVSVLAMVLAAAPGGFGSLGGLPFILLFFVAMYFLLFAPQQRKQKQWQAMLAQIKTGDKVTTTGGLRGTILAVKDDVFVIRVQPDNVKLEIVKSAIAAVTTEGEEKKA